MKKLPVFAILLMVILSMTVASAATFAPSSASATPTPPTLKSRPSDKAVVVTFVNKSAVALDYFWVGFDGKETQYGTIKAGASAVQQTFFTHVWIVRDPSKNIVLVYLATEAPKQTVTISTSAAAWAKKAAITSYPALKSLAGDKKVSLTLTNNSTTPLNIFWIDYAGKETKIKGFETVAPGKSASISTFFTHPWRLRDQAGHVILEYITTEETSQKVDISTEAVKFGK